MVGLTDRRFIILNWVQQFGDRGLMSRFYFTTVPLVTFTHSFITPMNRSCKYNLTMIIKKCLADHVFSCRMNKSTRKKKKKTLKFVVYKVLASTNPWYGEMWRAKARCYWNKSIKMTVKTGRNANCQKKLVSNWLVRNWKGSDLRAF